MKPEREPHANPLDGNLFAPTLWSFLDEGNQPSSPDFHQLLQLIYRHRWLVVFVFLTVMILTVMYNYLATPIYKANAKVAIRTSETAMPLFSSMYSGWVSQREITNQIEILKSRTLMEKTLARLRAFGPDVDLPVRQAQDPVGALQQALVFNPIRDTDLIEISATSASPEAAKLIVNTVIEVFDKESLDTSREKVREVRRFLDEQKQIAEERLRASEEELRAFKESSDVISFSGVTEKVLSELTTFESQLNINQTELESKESQLRQLQAQLQEIKGKPVDQNQSELYRELTATIVRKETRLIELLSQGYSETHPEIKDLRTEIEDAKLTAKELARAIIDRNEVDNPVQQAQLLQEQILALQVDIETLRAKKQALEQVVNNYQQRLTTLPTKELVLAELTRQVEVNKKIYLLLVEKLEEARIQEAGEIGNVVVIDPAIKPQKPVRPNRQRNILLGFILGLGLGIGVVMVKGYLNQTITTIEDIEQHFNLPLLGLIPVIHPEFIHTRKKRRALNRSSGKTPPDTMLITHHSPKSPVTEAYRTIRTSLQFATVDSPLQSILVTSCGPREGKSTTIANLAITLSRMGTKTLIVDTDLRRPSLHRLFRRPQQPGLVDILMNQADISDIIHTHILEEQDNSGNVIESNELALITSGTIPPNPSELIASSRMQALINRLKQQYDVILFDTPPVIPVTDAVVLSTRVDGVLLVFSAENTSISAVKRTLSILAGVHAHILGTVLNNFETKHYYGKYHYGRDYHTYYRHQPDHQT